MLATNRKFPVAWNGGGGVNEDMTSEKLPSVGGNGDDDNEATRVTGDPLYEQLTAIRAVFGVSAVILTIVQCMLMWHR